MLEQRIQPFEKELTDLINKFNIERLPDMPDFIIAKYLCTCLYALKQSIYDNNTWTSKHAYQVKRPIIKTFYEEEREEETK